MELSDIKVIGKTYHVDEVNQKLKMGWRLLFIGTEAGFVEFETGPGNEASIVFVLGHTQQSAWGQKENDGPPSSGA